MNKIRYHVGMAGKLGQHDNFDIEAAVGQSWAAHVADDLLAAGIACRASPLIIVDFEDRAQFSNEQDIILGDGSQCIEVKSRNLRFTEDPSSFPYKTAFVDTVSGWEKKRPTPLAVVLVSQLTNRKLVVPVSKKHKWIQTSSFDRVRKHPDVWYEVSVLHLRRYEDLKDWLRGRFPAV